MFRFVKYWLPVLIWSAVIFIVSAIPNLKSDLPSGWDQVLRKIAHMAEYAVFAMLLMRAFAQNEASRFWDIVAVVMIACTYAVSDEIHQASVVGRHGSMWDVGVDLVGIVIGSVLFYTVGKKAKEKKPGM